MSFNYISLKISVIVPQIELLRNDLFIHYCIRKKLNICIHILQAFWEMLSPKIEEFANQKETDIVSAMSILYIIDRFSLDVKPSAYIPLFRALVQVNVDYKEVISNFDEK